MIDRGRRTFGNSWMHNWKPQKTVSLGSQYFLSGDVCYSLFSVPRNLNQMRFSCYPDTQKHESTFVSQLVCFFYFKTGKK